MVSRVVVVDDARVTYVTPGGDTISILWPELKAVSVQNVGGAPHWKLEATEQTCLIRIGAEGSAALDARLKALPGFSEQAMTNAMCTVQDSEFLCWTKSSLRLRLFCYGLIGVPLWTLLFILPALITQGRIPPVLVTFSSSLVLPVGFLIPLIGLIVSWCLAVETIIADAIKSRIFALLAPILTSLVVALVHTHILSLSYLYAIFVAFIFPFVLIPRAARLRLRLNRR